MRSSSTAEAIALVMALLNVAANRGPQAIWPGFKATVATPSTTLRALARQTLLDSHEDVVRAVCHQKLDFSAGSGSTFEGAALDVDVAVLAQQNLTFVKFALKCDELRSEHHNGDVATDHELDCRSASKPPHADAFFVLQRAAGVKYHCG